MVCAVRKHQDTAPGMGKGRLSHMKARADSGDPRQQGQGYRVLRLLGIQAPLGVLEELRTEWRPSGWVQGMREFGEGELQ